MMAAKKKQLEIHNKLLFPTINKENTSYLPPQTKVKIADLSHNLINYENGILPDQSSIRLPTEAQYKKQGRTNNNGSLRKDNGSPGIQMSPH